jgi:hypothetical protein
MQQLVEQVYAEGHAIVRGFLPLDEMEHVAREVDRI